MWLVSNTFNMLILVAIPLSVLALSSTTCASNLVCSWRCAVISSRVIRKLFATMQNNAMLVMCLLPDYHISYFFVLGV